MTSSPGLRGLSRPQSNYCPQRCVTDYDRRRWQTPACKTILALYTMCRRASSADDSQPDSFLQCDDVLTRYRLTDLRTQDTSAPKHFGPRAGTLRH